MQQISILNCLTFGLPLPISEAIKPRGMGLLESAAGIGWRAAGVSLF